MIITIIGIALFIIFAGLLIIATSDSSGGDGTSTMVKIVAGALAVGVAGTGTYIALDDGGLHEQSRLVGNYCINTTRCDATLTINATAANETLQRNVNFFLTFEDKEHKIKTVKFHTNVEVYHYEWQNVTAERLVFVRNDTLPNGSMQPVYERKNITAPEYVRVDTGKKLQAGVENYVHIWTDDFDELWADWHIAADVPKEILGVAKTVRFDTHNKGWAVWQFYSSNHLAYWNETAEIGTIDSRGWAFTTNKRPIFDTAHAMNGSKAILVYGDSRYSQTSHTITVPTNVNLTWYTYLQKPLDGYYSLTGFGGNGYGNAIGHHRTYSNTYWVILLANSAWELTNVPMTAGWHQMEIRKVGTNYTYVIDGIIVKSITDATTYTEFGSTNDESSEGEYASSTLNYWLDDMHLWNATIESTSPSVIYALQNLTNMEFYHNGTPQIMAVKWNVTNSSPACVAINISSNDSAHPIDNRSGWINLTGPNISATGFSWVNFTARDNCSNQVTNIVWINITNAAPTNNWGSGSVWQLGHNDGVTALGGGGGSDTDGDSITCSMNDTAIYYETSTTLKRNLAMGLTDIGVHSIEQSCTDGLATTDATRSVNITNTAPIFSCSNQSYKYYVNQTLCNVTDLDNDALTLTINDSMFKVSGNSIIYIANTSAIGYHIIRANATDSISMSSMLFSVNITNIFVTRTYCGNIPSIKYIANTSLINATTGKTTQSVFANGTLIANCTLAYNVPNETVNLTLWAAVNATNPGYKVQMSCADAVAINLTTTYQSIKSIVPNSSLKCNLTGYWINSNNASFPVALLSRVIY